MSEKKILKITLQSSLIGRKPKHRATVHALGLKRINQSVEVQETPSILGMINKVNYLLNVQEV